MDQSPDFAFLLARHGWIACVLAMMMVATAAAQQPPVQRDGSMDRDPSDQVLMNDLVPAPEYWLGLECQPVPSAVRSQLNLSEKQGMMVQNVVPESPAAKAGIVRHDILWAVGEKPLTRPKELIQAIEATKAEKITLDVIHAGKHKAIEITPAKRPEGATRNMVRLMGEADWNMWQKWIDHQMSMSGQPASGPLQFRFFHPGAILPQVAAQPMPPDMSITVSKEGDQPAKITVKKGNDTWEATEKDLQVLPADVRPFVDRLLGHGPLGVAGIEQLRDPATSGLTPDVTGELPQNRQLEQRLEEMTRRMEQMMRLLDEPGRLQSRPQANTGSAPAPVPENPSPKGTEK